LSIIICEKNTLYNQGVSLQKNISLTTNFSNKELLVTRVTNLYTNLQNKNYWLLK